MGDVAQALREAVRRGLDDADVGVAEPVVVACSGGPDSLALADTLRRDRAIAVVYVDHQLRDTSAERALIERTAARWQVDHRIVPVEVDETRASLEAAAREVRYPALERAADELGIEWIATGHTASDQAETVLLRVLRGTGVEGLAGIARRRGRIVRPLLGVGRAEVVAYLEAVGLEPAIDPTNAERVFARNRVRHEILPVMVAENPRIERALCRLAASAVELRAVVDDACADLAGRAAVDGGLSAPVLAAAQPLVAKRVLGDAAAAAGCGELEASHLEALLDLAAGPARGTVSVDLPGGRAVREYDAIRIGEIAPARVELRVSGPDDYQVRPWKPGDRMRPTRLGGRSKKLSDLFIDAKVPRRLREGARVVVRRSDGVIEWAEHLGSAYLSRVVVE